MVFTDPAYHGILYTVFLQYILYFIYLRPEVFSDPKCRFFWWAKLSQGSYTPLPGSYTESVSLSSSDAHQVIKMKTGCHFKCFVAHSPRDKNIMARFFEAWRFGKGKIDDNGKAITFCCLEIMKKIICVPRCYVFCSIYNRTKNKITWSWMRF